MQPAPDAEAPGFPRKAPPPSLPQRPARLRPGRASAGNNGAQRGKLPAPRRPLGRPASHLAQSRGTSLRLPVPPPRPPGGRESFPPNLCPPVLERSPMPPRASPRSGAPIGAPHAPSATHLRRTGLGPTPGAARGRGARAPQKRAAPRPPHPCRLWEKFQAALQRAAGRLAAKSTAEGPAGPGGVSAGSGQPRARTFSCSAGAYYLWGARAAGRPRRLLSMLGRGCSRSPRVTLLGEGRGRSRG